MPVSLCDVHAKKLVQPYTSLCHEYQHQLCHHLLQLKQLFWSLKEKTLPDMEYAMSYWWIKKIFNLILLQEVSAKQGCKNCWQELWFNDPQFLHNSDSRISSRIGPWILSELSCWTATIVHMCKQKHEIGNIKCANKSSSICLKGPWPVHSNGQFSILVGKMVNCMTWWADLQSHLCWIFALTMCSDELGVHVTSLLFLAHCGTMHTFWTIAFLDFEMWILRNELH